MDAILFKPDRERNQGKIHTQQLPKIRYQGNIEYYTILHVQISVKHKKQGKEKLYTFPEERQLYLKRENVWIFEDFTRHVILFVKKS